MQAIFESAALLRENGKIRTWAQYKKAVLARIGEFMALAQTLLTALEEAKWLTDKFGEGEYRDIPGLCRIADRAAIREKGYSLTPGAYVGVTAAKEDDVDFAQRMRQLHRELLCLQAQNEALMDTISKNLEEMGL